MLRSTPRCARTCRIYAVDSRGLEAIASRRQCHLGELARQCPLTAAPRCRTILTRTLPARRRWSPFANDTGGKAFLDSNDFSKAYAKVQADSESYYVLGYRSSNPARDGRFRHIQVKLNRKDVKLEYRTGYYGPRDFQHFTKEDREAAVAGGVARAICQHRPAGVHRQRILPRRGGQVLRAGKHGGAGIGLAVQRDKDKASLDVLGIVREKNTRFPLGTCETPSS